MRGLVGFNVIQILVDYCFIPINHVDMEMIPLGLGI